jgi:hypothetical protein
MHSFWIPWSHTRIGTKESERQCSLSVQEKLATRDASGCMSTSRTTSEASTSTGVRLWLALLQQPAAWWLRSTDPPLVAADARLAFVVRAYLQLHSLSPSSA